MSEPMANEYDFLSPVVFLPSLNTDSARPNRPYLMGEALFL